MLKKRIKLLAVVFCLLMVFSSNITAFAAGNDEEAIKEKLYEYFDNQFKNLQGLRIVESVIKPSALNAENKLFYDTEQAALTVQLDFLSNQKEDLSFKTYSYSLNFTDINITGSSAEVKLTEDHEIQYNFLDTPSYLKDKPHVFRLVKENENWSITDHEDDSLLKTAIKKELQAGKSIDQITDEKIQQNRRSLKALSVLQEKDNALKIATLKEENLSIGEITPLAYSARTFNRAAAVKYARDYATKNNPSPWTTYSADCTNFVSIALYNGGLPKDSSGSNTWYWNSTSDKTSSWTAARYLRPYLINNKGSSSTYGVNARSISYGSAETADVISFHNGERISHSAIVSSFKTDNQGLHYGWTVCQHSYGSGKALDYPLSTMIATYGSSNVYCTWIINYYK